MPDDGARRAQLIRAVASANSVHIITMRRAHLRRSAEVNRALVGGVTVTELAEELGVARSTIYAWRRPRGAD